MDGREVQGWIVVHTTGTDYEADLVRDRLDDSGIPAVVLTQRDHAFNLTVGRMAPVHVLVPVDHVADARALLLSPPLTDRELTEVAMAADPEAPTGRDPDLQEHLDTGIDRIRLRPPRDTDDIITDE